MNTWIQALLIYTNSKTVDTRKTKAHNRPMFRIKKNNQPNTHRHHSLTLPYQWQKLLYAWSASGTAIPTFFEKPCARTVENHLREGSTARKKKKIIIIFCEATPASSTSSTHFLRDLYISYRLHLAINHYSRPKCPVFSHAKFLFLMDYNLI